MRSSELPAIAGEMTELYLRERVLPGTLARSRDFRGRVALFVHGAGTPAEVAFDVPYGSYSWMAHLAAAGFDVFAMDVTGYGRSSRPSVMNDRCNLSQAEQAVLFEEACGNASYPFQLGNIGSDWADIDAVVDYIRELRGVERVSLLGWSLGGPRAGGYAANNPAKVGRLVLLAPAYAADLQRDPPADLPVAGIAMNKQSRRDFIANWDRQVGCAGQYDAEVAAVIFAEMLASDPVGSTWGTGVRRAPGTTVWGWNRDRVTRMRTPTLIVQGIHDAQVTPDRARALYQDLGSDAKVYIDLGCASHNAMWESVHLQMFDASLEWLQSGTVNGQSQGIIEMGYE
jgi:pimeloyl-ACP methyl ester carboxylesterase